MDKYLRYMTEAFGIEDGTLAKFYALGGSFTRFPVAIRTAENAATFSVRNCFSTPINRELSVVIGTSDLVYFAATNDAQRLAEASLCQFLRYQSETKHLGKTTTTTTVPVPRGAPPPPPPPVSRTNAESVKCEPEPPSESEVEAEAGVSDVSKDSRWLNKDQTRRAVYIAFSKACGSAVRCLAANNTDLSNIHVIGFDWTCWSEPHKAIMARALDSLWLLQ